MPCAGEIRIRLAPLVLDEAHQKRESITAARKFRIDVSRRCPLIRRVNRTGMHSITVRQLALTAALAGSMCVSVHAQTLGGEQIFAEPIDRNQTRAGGLLEYTADRVYRVPDPSGTIHAQIEGRMEFEAPESKTFVTKSEEGSDSVRLGCARDGYRWRRAAVHAVPSE
jgi:hypothetical protein